MIRERAADILRNPWRVAVPVVVVLGLGTIGCGGDDDTDSGPGPGPDSATTAEAAPCVSGRTISPNYPGDTSAQDGEQSEWQRGVRVTTQLPEGAVGIIIGFAGIEGDAWHDSLPVSPAEAADIVASVGPDDVRFSTQLQGPPGSDVCDVPPNSEFSEPPDGGNFDLIVLAGATPPTWP